MFIVLVLDGIYKNNVVTNVTHFINLGDEPGTLVLG